MHGLRHTHATILMNNGIPVKAITKRLGNTPEMIPTVYGHILQEMEAQTVSVFSQSLKENGASLLLTPLQPVYINIRKPYLFYPTQNHFS
ncbi:DNA integration/recombination/inversion protein [Lysinibacillus sp. NPDC092081]|uniref:DNA integration/recombination/inversion protein n=1 Tax=Lysinibacillus sp. NPDC092081 TaxID=3364131 RepID=UPI00381B865D